jgi:putative ABC transport system substrate-binding protein
MAGTVAERESPRVISERPLVFMIVADPVGSGIVESYQSTGRANVTGTRNRVPEKVNVETMRAYLPSFGSLGLLFNRDEPNSVLKMEELRRLSTEMGFELVAREIELDADGRPLAASIAPRLAEIKAAGADFLYFGSSSFLRVHGDAFTRSAVKLGLPLLSPYEKLVRDSGALLSVAAPYREVGRLAARQIVRILGDGVVPGDLPVLALDRYAYVVNMATAKRLGLFPPIDFLQFAETVD